MCTRLQISLQIFLFGVQIGGSFYIYVILDAILELSDTNLELSDVNMELSGIDLELSDGNTVILFVGFGLSDCHYGSFYLISTFRAIN